ncbi:CatB-related O-acetyltransferase [Sulfitobacter sp. R18_1]|uniref:CatB-related O-acetyltransferase n=1 Tax=Sulfitobacter sp. R18_1 TaxID=2821104 RepID=UPI001ADB9E6E|nr:CatB-related O-acetyltransferase [Sulfitobacter sp. R18_1]
MERIKTVQEAQKLGLLIQNLNQITRQVTFEAPVKLSDTGCLGSEKIGMLSYLGKGSEMKNAEIGRFCSIASNVTIGPPEHPIDWVSSHPVQYDGLRWYDNFEGWWDFEDKSEVFRGNRKKTIIGHDVWIGRNAIIRQGVTVGVGAVIGANAFVNKDVAPYTIVGGVPAKAIKKRFSDELIGSLIESDWWHYKLPKEVKALFSQPEKFVHALAKAKTSGDAKLYKAKTITIKREGKEFFAIDT